MEQNPRIFGLIAVVYRWKVNRIIKTFGAGDGNRTHVRSLGSFYTAIVRRPLANLDGLYTIGGFSG